MNKWQIICPLSVMFLIGLWGLYNLHVQAGKNGQALRAAIRQELEAALNELQAHPDGGRFPGTTAARELFDNETIARHFSGPIDAKNLWYNPAQPSLGSGADVIAGDCAGYYSVIRANHEVRAIDKAELEKAGFVILKPEAPN